MNRKTLVALIGAAALALAASGAALAARPAGPAVTVTIRTLTKTLKNTVAHGERGWITRYGAPKGRCSGTSAAGALDAVTHGSWRGKWDSKFDDYFVTSILGVTPKGKDYWGIFVNGKMSSFGVCGTRLRAHERLLFKIVR